MDFFGGGLVFAVAAALWIVYLIPSWIRRRNFVATEQNAVRMQQTLRVLLETSENPVEVQAEITARGVRDQKRALRLAEQQARAKVYAAQREERLGSAEQRAAVAKHRRRTYRLIAFILFSVGVLAAVAGVALLGYTGSPAVLIAGASAVVIALVAFRVITAISRRALAQVTTPVQQVAPQRFEMPSVAPADTRSWTPQPLPKPMHLQAGSLAQQTVAQVSVAERIRQAAREEALRARMDEASSIAHASRVIARDEVLTPQATDPIIEQEVLEAMGQVNAVSAGALNLDEVFRRRAAS